MKIECIENRDARKTRALHLNSFIWHDLLIHIYLSYISLGIEKRSFSLINIVHTLCFWFQLKIIKLNCKCKCTYIQVSAGALCNYANFCATSCDDSYIRISLTLSYYIQHWLHRSNYAFLWYLLKRILLRAKEREILVFCAQHFFTSFIQTDTCQRLRIIFLELMTKARDFFMRLHASF